MKHSVHSNTYSRTLKMTVWVEKLSGYRAEWIASSSGVYWGGYSSDPGLWSLEFAINGQESLASTGYWHSLTDDTLQWYLFV